MASVESVLLLIVAFYLLYRYLTRSHDYWRAKGVPGPRPIPFFGTYLTQFFVPFQDSEIERYEKYGKIYGIFDGSTPGLIVGRPDLVREIMVGKTALDNFINRRAVKTTHPVMAKFLSSLEDDEWKRVRSITTPTFSSGKLKAIIPFMNQASKEMMNTLRSKAKNREDVDLKNLFGTYTMDVIANSAFATPPTPHFVNQATQLFTFPFWRKFLDYAFPMRVLELFKFTVLPRTPMEFFRDITIKIIQKRRLHNEEHSDFLQLLIKAEANDESCLSNKNLTEEEILAQAVLFFSVGFETSSQLLTYACYCLALNQESQDLAYREIKDAISESGSREVGDDFNLSNDDLQHLPYTNAVIDETLRLYNPVLRMERRAQSDFVLGDTGIIVEKGMIVGIPVWALHHSEEYYPDPWEFKPERFLPENRQNITPGTFLPFGDGPRNCIGSRFALLECKLAMAKILMKFKLIPSPNTKIPLEFFPTGRPLLGPYSVLIRVEQRL